MELVGEEKRIHALFSESRIADGQTTPSFSAVWNRAQAEIYRPRKAFNLAFVAATALLVCALVSLAWWSSRERGPRVIASAPAVIGTVPATSAVRNFESGNRDVNPRRLKRVALNSRLRAVKLAARREAMLLAANKNAERDAQAIASWKSPTARLLDSASDGLLKSLPEMNQTVDEMKSFLPSQPK